MQLSKSQLKRIIQEELYNILEAKVDREGAAQAGAYGALRGPGAPHGQEGPFPEYYGGPETGEEVQRLAQKPFVGAPAAAKKAVRRTLKPEEDVTPQERRTAVRTAGALTRHAIRTPTPE